MLVPCHRAQSAQSRCGPIAGMGPLPAMGKYQLRKVLEPEWHPRPSGAAPISPHRTAAQRRRRAADNVACSGCDPRAARKCGATCPPPAWRLQAAPQVACVVENSLHDIAQTVLSQTKSLNVTFQNLKWHIFKIWMKSAGAPFENLKCQNLLVPAFSQNLHRACQNLPMA